jgi:hypothetical protein
MPQNRTKTGRWAPGHSGNPGGRPATAREFAQRCQDFMSTEGWPRLRALAEGDGPSALRALELIIAYAYGKPMQPVGGAEGGPVHFSLDIGTADLDQ